MDKLAQVYKITYLPDNRYYIGITWGKRHSYLRRIKKHMNGKGSCYIRDLLLNGATENDFTFEVIYECELLDARELEKELSILYPKGLNGNKGNAIIQTEEGKRIAQEKRNLKREQTNKKTSKTLKDNNKINRSKNIIKHNKVIDFDKRSVSLKNYLHALTKEELNERMKKSAHSLTKEQQIERGKKISKSKKGKVTNQRKITKARYKSMSNKEFEEWCVGRKQFIICRATNIRNE